MNAFKYCRNSPIAAARLAYKLWALSPKELLQYIEDEGLLVDPDLAVVYMEWLDEACFTELKG